MKTKYYAPPPMQVRVALSKTILGHHIFYTPAGGVSFGSRVCVCVCVCVLILCVQTMYMCGICVYTLYWQYMNWRRTSNQNTSHG